MRGGIGIGLFDQVGPGGTVLLRSLFEALVLLAVAGRRLRTGDRNPWLNRDALASGFVLAAMNLAFYEAMSVYEHFIPSGFEVALLNAAVEHESAASAWISRPTSAS